MKQVYVCVCVHVYGICLSMHVSMYLCRWIWQGVRQVSGYVCIRAQNEAHPYIYYKCVYMYVCVYIYICTFCDMYRHIGPRDQQAPFPALAFCVHPAGEARVILPKVIP